MNHSLHTWLSLLLAGAVVYVLLAGMLLRRPHGPGARPVGWGLLAIGVWVAAAAAEPWVPTLGAYLLVVRVKYTAIAFVPPLFFLFFIRYAERIPPRAWHAPALLLVPAATVALVWSNPWHELMWASPPLGPEGERLARLPWGPWYWWVHVPYSYALLAGGLGLLASELWGESKLYRAQVALLLGAALLPSASNVAFVVLGWGDAAFSPTPVAFALSGVLFSWGYLRLQLFRLSPVAYRVAFDHIQDAVLVTDAFDRIVDLNPAARELAGRPLARLLGYRAQDVLPFLHGDALRAGAGAALACETPGGRLLEGGVSVIERRHGGVRGRVILLRDVTERRRAEAALRESEALVRSIVDHSPNGILRLRPRRGPDGAVRDFVCVFANPAAAQLAGVRPEELVDHPFKAAVRPHAAGLFQLFREVVDSGRPCDVERSVARDDGESWFRFIAVRMGDDLLVTFADVTERKLREYEMEAAASTDPLTGVLNRRGLDHDGPRLLEDADGMPRPCSLLYVDLDDFKRVNDAFGHEAGDFVLCEVAARLHRCTRGPDLLARIGGDEFVLLLPDTDLAGAQEVAARVLAALREPVAIARERVVCGASIGVASCPGGRDALKRLLQAADRAMYEAKAVGGCVRSAAPA